MFDSIDENSGFARFDKSAAQFGADHASTNSTHMLEFHHRDPYARGGEATVENIALHCRSHNQHQARLDFGPWARTG